MYTGSITRVRRSRTRQISSPVKGLLACPYAPKILRPVRSPLTLSKVDSSHRRETASDHRFQKHRPRKPNIAIASTPHDGLCVGFIHRAQFGGDPAYGTAHRQKAFFRVKLLASMPCFTLVGTANTMTGRSDYGELLALKSRIWTTFVPPANRQRDSRRQRGLRIHDDTRSSEVLMSRSCCFSRRAFLPIACVWGICRARTNSFRQRRGND
jgi:hypothetical protein